MRAVNRSSRLRSRRGRFYRVILQPVFLKRVCVMGLPVRRRKVLSERGNVFPEGGSMPTRTLARTCALLGLVLGTTGPALGDSADPFAGATPSFDSAPEEGSDYNSGDWGSPLILVDGTVAAERDSRWGTGMPISLHTQVTTPKSRSPFCSRRSRPSLSDCFFRNGSLTSPRARENKEDKL